MVIGAADEHQGRGAGCDLHLYFDRDGIDAGERECVYPDDAGLRCDFVHARDGDDKR